jgi:hypothetical protein
VSVGVALIRPGLLWRSRADVGAGAVRRFGCCTVAALVSASVAASGSSSEARGAGTSEELTLINTCIYQKQRKRGCIYRDTPWTRARRVWNVSDWCGIFIYGNTVRLTMQTGHTGVYGDAVRLRRGVWQTYGGFVRAWSKTPVRWEILDRKKRRVAWAHGPDGPAAGLASLLDDSCLEP